MANDFTAIDSFGWDALKKALNQRVVVNSYRLIPSRRNRVWVVETDVRPVIVKQSLSGRCGTEFETLLLARQAGIEVPYPLFKEGDFLVMEYISGETCEVMINHMFSSAAAEESGRWLANFHEQLAFGSATRIMGDAVLSNFIMGEGRLFGVDLEDCAKGTPFDDLGQLAASILGSEPFFTPIKFDLCAHMIARYEKTAHVDALEKVRPFVAKHLRNDARRKPLFRRTLLVAAKSIEKGWPELA